MSKIKYAWMAYKDGVYVGGGHSEVDVHDAIVWYRSANPVGVVAELNRRAKLQNNMPALPGLPKISWYYFNL